MNIDVNNNYKNHLCNKVYRRNCNSSRKQPKNENAKGSNWYDSTLHTASDLIKEVCPEAILEATLATANSVDSIRKGQWKKAAKEGILAIEQGLSYFLPDTVIKAATCASHSLNSARKGEWTNAVMGVSAAFVVGATYVVNEDFSSNYVEAMKFAEQMNNT